MAKNDWIVAGVNNPLYNTQDFVNIGGLTLENTQMLDREEYLKSDFIRNNDAFKDEHGNFSEETFDQYYNYKLQEFQQFANDDFYRGPALDLFDIRRTTNTPIRDTHFSIDVVVNPDKQQIGIEGVNIQSAPTLSKRELAKSSKVWNTEEQKWEDYTVEESALLHNPVKWFNNILSQRLVLATWDEEGEHIDPITGQVTKHYKGQEKLNDEGTYYYETLAGRPIWGKQLLNATDTFTVTGSGINKYDFFDSDDIDKSVIGSVMKAAVSILPLFTPVADVYAAYLFSKSLADMLPAVYGICTAFNEDKFPEWVNNIGAAARFASPVHSKSDYAMTNTFAWENIASLMGDVVAQLSGQMWLSKSIMRLTPGGRALKKAEILKDEAIAVNAARFPGQKASVEQAAIDMYIRPAQEAAHVWEQAARNISLGWMVGGSLPIVWEELMEKGLSKKEAAAVSLGSAIGMYAVDKYLGLGEIFFNPNPSLKKQIAKSITNHIKDSNIFTTIKNDTEKTGFQKIISYITSATDISKEATENYFKALKNHTAGFIGKTTGEGLEEVVEQVAIDCSKALYELAGDFGFETTTDDAGAFENVFDRYLMNFIGGVAGGGIFYGKHIYQNGFYRSPTITTDFATLIRNGHADKLRETITNWRDKGKLASTNLSVVRPEVGSDGKIQYKTTDNIKESQNQFMYEYLMQKIDQMEIFINGNRLNLTDQELFDNMVLSNVRYSHWEGLGDLTNYAQDFTTLLGKLADANSKLVALDNSTDGDLKHVFIDDTAAKLKKRTEAQERTWQPLHDKAQEEYDKIKAQMDYFLSADNSLYYVRKMQFLADPVLHSRYLSIDAESFCIKNFNGKHRQELTNEEADSFNEKWSDYVHNELKTKADVMFNQYLQKGEVINPYLKEIQEWVPTYIQYNQSVQEFIESDALADLAILGNTKDLFNLTLEGETAETSKANREALLQSGDERAINVRIEKASEEVQNRVVKKIQEFIDKNGGRVDPQILRLIKQTLPIEKLATQMLRSAAIIYSTPEGFAPDENVQKILLTLKPDFSNKEAVKENLKKLIVIQLTQRVAAIKKSWGTKCEDPILKNAVGQLVNELEDSDIELNEYTIGQLFHDMYEHLDNSDHRKQSLKNIDAWVSKNPIVADSDITLDIWENLSPAELEALTTLIVDTVRLQTDLQASDINNTNYDNPDNWTIEALISGEFNTILDTDSSNVQEYKTSLVDEMIEALEEQPLYVLQTQLQAVVKNPVAELVKKIAAEQGDDLSDIDGVLETIISDYENLQNIADFQLNITQQVAVQKAIEYLKLVYDYIYAASTVPSASYPIGHNHNINEFARINSDKLIEPWVDLPQLDSDFAMAFLDTTGRYIMELETWKYISQQLQLNREAVFSQTEVAVSKALFETLEAIPTITVNGNQYNLLEGANQIDTELLTKNNGEQAQVALYQLEKLIYDNVQKCIAENNITLTELVQKHQILETLIPDLKKINSLECTAFSPKTTATSITPYTKLLYITTLLSLDPKEFMQNIADRINGDANVEIAPITVQEFSARVALASNNQHFRNIIEYARNSIIEDSNIKALPFLSNVTIITGVAGAGKTKAVLQAVNSVVKENILIAAPTEGQAKQLASSLGRDRHPVKTFKQLITDFIGESTYKQIQEEVNSNTGGCEFTGNYVKTVIVGKLIQAFIDENAIAINKTGTKPSAIFLDEATHLSTVDALILNKIAKEFGIQIFMLGDTNQKGFLNKGNGIANINSDKCVAIRTPNLVTSLRDSNLQKFNNNNMLRNMLDCFNNLLLKDPASYPNLYKVLKDSEQLKAIHLQVYKEGDSLCGDLITKELTDENLKCLKKLQSINKTIAFIGDKTSPRVKQLQDAGINLVDGDNLLSIEEMQGREFDYVVVDHKFVTITGTPTAKEFFQDLYTLSTRAMEGVIFVDPTETITATIGDNQVDLLTQAAPSLKQSARNLTIRKLKALSQILGEDITTPAISRVLEPVNQESKLESDIYEGLTEAEKKEIQSTISAAQILADMDTNGQDKSLQNAQSWAFFNNVDVFADQSIDDFPIQTYTNTYYIGAKIESNGDWAITTQGSTLRNMQALYANDTSLKSVPDKRGAIINLCKVRNAIMFNSKFEALPQIVRSIIGSKKAWENGVFKVEARLRSTEDNQSPFKPFNKQYYGGTTLLTGIPETSKVILSLIYEIHTDSKKTIKIDLATLNSPDSLLKNTNIIIKSLERAKQKAIDTKRTGPEWQKTAQALDARIQALKNNEVQAHYLDVIKPLVEMAMCGEEATIELPKGAVCFKRNTPIERFYLKDARGNIVYDSNTHLPKHGNKALPLSKHNLNNAQNMQAEDIEWNNPDKVFSNIYIICESSDPTQQVGAVDGNLQGRACVFVSNDLSLAPSDLVNAYSEQLKNPALPLRVRMIILENKGLTISEVCHLNQTSENLGGGKIPLRFDRIGVNMFHSLWNARAALLNLQNDANADVPYFRLTDQVNKSGELVTVDVKADSRWTSEGKANFIGIKNKADLAKYIKIIDFILYRLTDQGSSVTSLGIKVMQNGVQAKPTDFIGTGKDGNISSLKGLLQITPEWIRIKQGTDNQNAITFSEDAIWSTVYKVVVSVINIMSTSKKNEVIEVTKNGQTRSMIFSVEDLKNANIFSTDIENLLSLIFHGTIESLYSESGIRQDLPKATHAYFKEGIHINPSASSSQGVVTLTTKTADGRTVTQTLRQSNISKEFYLSDVDLYPTEVVISLNGIMGKKTQVVTEAFEQGSTEESKPVEQKPTEQYSQEESKPTEGDISTKPSNPEIKVTPEAKPDQGINKPIDYEQIIDFANSKKGKGLKQMIKSYGLRNIREFNEKGFEKARVESIAKLKRNATFQKEPLNGTYRIYDSEGNPYNSVEAYVRAMVAKDPKLDENTIVIDRLNNRFSCKSAEDPNSSYWIVIDTKNVGNDLFYIEKNTTTEENVKSEEQAKPFKATESEWVGDHTLVNDLPIIYTVLTETIPSQTELMAETINNFPEIKDDPDINHYLSTHDSYNSISDIFRSAIFRIISPFQNSQFEVLKALGSPPSDALISDILKAVCFDGISADPNNRITMYLKERLDSDMFSIVSKYGNIVYGTFIDEGVLNGYKGSFTPEETVKIQETAKKLQNLC